jgi:hypothetical protein
MNAFHPGQAIDDRLRLPKSLGCSLEIAGLANFHKPAIDAHRARTRGVEEDDSAVVRMLAAPSDEEAAGA